MSHTFLLWSTVLITLALILTGCPRKAIPVFLACWITIGALTACGNNNTTTSSTTKARPVIRNQDPWTKQQIINALDLRSDETGRTMRKARPSDVSSVTPSGCDISVILTSKPLVDLYADAGDTIVTNPDGTAGVKTNGNDPACLEELRAGLAKLTTP